MKSGFLLSSASDTQPTTPPNLPDCVSKVDFQIDRLLGSGNYCEVFEVTHLKSHRKYALKIVDRDRVTQLQKQDDVLMEKHCMMRLSTSVHPNIIQLLRTFKDDKALYLLYDLCEGGELWQYIRPTGISNLTTARKLFGQILNGLEYIHDNQIVHRDLKAENMLLTKHGDLVIIDFGTAVDLQFPQLKGAGNRSRGPKGKVFEHYVGTPQFLPPEAIKNIQTDMRNDLWTLGCLFYQILTGSPPFQAPSEYLVYCKILDLRLEFPPNFDPLAEDLIRRLLRPRPEDRLGASEGIKAIRSHGFFSGFDFDDCCLSPVPLKTLSEQCLSIIAPRVVTFAEQLDVVMREDFSTVQDGVPIRFIDQALSKKLELLSTAQHNVPLRCATANMVKRVEFEEDRRRREGWREDGYWEREFPLSHDQMKFQS